MSAIKNCIFETNNADCLRIANFRRNNFKKFEMVQKNTQETIETFIEGHDPMERIVNLDYNYNEDFITVIYRNEQDQKCSKKEFFHPFCWATLSACLRLCNGNREEVKRLMAKFGVGVKKLSNTSIEGIERHEFDDGYRFMFYAKRAMSYQNFLGFFKAAGNPVYSKAKDENEMSKSESKQYLIVTPQEQFLIATGKRFFKGYDDYDQLLKMTFDLETTGLNVKTDKITQIGIRINRPFVGHPDGFQRIINITGDTEEERAACELWAIDQMFKMIYTFEPDVITAHNGEDFDWNVIIYACERLGTSIDKMSSKYFKGDSIRKETRESILKLGGEMETYYQTIVPRVIVTDSLHAVRRAQALDSNMLRADLKYVTKYSKLNKPNRVYTPGEKISEIWADEEEHYAFNDENGDWYLYDPINGESRTEKVIANPLMTVEYFQHEIDEEKDFYNENNPEAIFAYEERLKDEIVEAKMDNLEEDIEEFDDESFRNSITEKELNKWKSEFTFKDWAEADYKRGDTRDAETRYNDYIKSIEDKNRLKLGKEGDKPFVLYSRNYIADGYVLKSGRYIIERYLYDDLYECDKVEHRYNTPNFLICKMLPVPYKKCTTMGTAGQWKALMLAWSYENGLAVPMFRESHSFTGGLSRLLKVGFVDDVAKYDYNSLYPSIILTWAISDNTDLMKSMLHFLEYVLSQREKYKKLKKQAGKKANAIKERLHNHEYQTAEEGRQLQLEMMKWKQEESANDKKQLPLKILGNSFFGSYGAPNVFPWGSLKCAEQTTCTGRQCLRLMISHFTKLGYQPIVGDSFTPDTPVFIRYNDDEMIDIKPISELIDESKIEVDTLGREYDYSKKNYKVLCRSGWVEPQYIYRHKTDKDIYEVSDSDMKIEVTEDHSLFDISKNKLNPKNITENTELEYYTDEVKGRGVCLLDGDYTRRMAINLANGVLSKIPSPFLNTTYYQMQLFYDTFMQNYRNDIEYSKTCIAGLQYLKKHIAN